MLSSTEREQIRLLDAFWDDGVASDDLDRALVRTMHGLGVLRERVVPRPAFAAELWRRLPTDAQTSPSRTGGRRPARRASRVAGRLAVPRLAPRFGAGLPGTVTTASAVVLTLLLVVVAFRPAGSPSRSAGPVGPAAPVALWNVRYDDEGPRLTRLDPETLADAAPETSMAEHGWGNWLLSADGTTLVTFQADHTPGQELAETTVEVYDGLSGPRRARYVFPNYVNNARLSSDGSRLTIDVLPDPSQLGTVGLIDPPEWYSLDTVTGRVYASIPADPEHGWPAGSWIDPAGTRGFRLYLRYSNTEVGPWPVVVVGYDLSTGAELGRLELPEVRGGSWAIGAIVDEWGNSYPKGRLLQPGVAVAPDGRTLALVHADEDAVTIVDAERMAIVDTVSFERQESVGARLLDFLSFAPAEAAAKTPSVGTVRQAAFAADGRRLYLWGYEQTENEDGQLVTQGAGLRLVDVANGEIVQEAMPDAVVFDLAPTVDGRELYVSEVVDGSDGSIYWLRRLDPDSLAVEAERFLGGSPRILVRPAVPSGEGYHPEGEGYR